MTIINYNYRLLTLGCPETWKKTVTISHMEDPFQFDGLPLRYTCMYRQLRHVREPGGLRELGLFMHAVYVAIISLTIYESYSEMPICI